jgi:outer membrane receptor protein involved in Fe transport
MNRSKYNSSAAAALRRLGLALLLAALGTGAAVAQDAKVSLSIPSEPAGTALQDLTRQSGLQVFAPAEDLKGVRTNAVRGSFTPLEAAQLMLAGTGLEILKTGDNSITIRRPPAGANSGKTGASADEALNEVIVTGTRIRRAGFDTLETALVTTSKDISTRGYTNVLQALQATPGFGEPGSSALGDEQARLGIAQSFANFFGLGSQRTLTLVDGHRYVSSNTVAGSGSNASPGSQVDLNLIPVNLIDHIETIAIGGAPVYGADAIAGTVNIILKNHFQGVEATGQYGISGRGDAQNEMFSLLVGSNFDHDRGNAALSVQYTKQDPLRFSNRYGLLYALPNAADTGPNDGIPANILNPDTHLDFVTEGGLPYDGSILDVAGLHYPGLYPNGNYIFNTAGQPLRFAPNGQLVPMNLGSIANSAELGGGAYVPLYSAGGDGVNAADHFGLLAGTNSTLVNALGHYDITSGLRATLNVSYAHSEGVLPSDLTSIVSPNLIGATSLSFSIDNPYLSSQAHDIIAANGLTTFNLARNMNDIADLFPAESVEDVYRAVAGLEGTFHALGEEMSWNASYDYGNSRTRSTDAYIDPTRLLLAADAVRDASGNIACASGGDCVPIDLFGENAFTRQAAAYVVDPGVGIDVNTEQDITSNLSGALPVALGKADPVKFNVGYEHRVETGRFDPDANFEAGDQLDGVPGYSAISGSYHTNEVYGETVLPAISDKEHAPLIKSAELDSAVRYVKNSVAGGGVTWSAGGRFAPRFAGLGDGLLLRGVFTHAIRDPAITELFLTSAGVLNGIDDPCDARNVSSGPNPAARLANCTAALAAAGAPSPQNFGSTTQSISVAGTQSGNPSLQNEVANSWSLGLVYQPQQHPHFRFSADWSEISLKNGIQLLDINSLLSACYDSNTYPDNACGQFSRLTASQVSSPRTVGDIAAGYRQGFVNTSNLDFSGLIAVTEYHAPLGDISPAMSRWGAIDITGTVFYLDRYDLVAFAGQPVTHEAGTIGLPKYKAELGLGYTLGRFDADWQILWSSRSLLSNTVTYEDYPQLTVPSYTLVNLTAGYQFTDYLRAQAVVNNVFNKGLPLVALEDRAFSLYDPLGRTFVLRVTADLGGR